MPGRTWRSVEKENSEEIKEYLLAKGGIEEEIKNSHEGWRVRFSDSTFTYYVKGTIYSSPSESNDPAVLRAWKHIDSIVGSAYALPTKDFLIGLDETGKGEIIGHTILAGVIIPKTIFNDVDVLVGPADTKKHHSFGYWDEIFKRLDHFRMMAFDYIIEKVPPWHVDRFNLNKIIDVSYQKILSIFLRKAEPDRCRIVLDDYGVGPTLNRFLKFLENQGAEVVVTTNAEDSYLEAKTASLISKRSREAVMKAINDNPDFQIDGISVGSGNAGDKQTLKWLEMWHAAGRKWPWFVKRSFKTVLRIECKTGAPKKIVPPIREELLSEEFFESFNKGNLSVQALSVVCPHCGSILKSAMFATFERDGRPTSILGCSNSECGELIEDAGMTLRYYCGYVVLDSSAIQRNLISNDLRASRFFENFTVILDPVVRSECDGTPRGKREFERLAGYNSMGRIRLEAVGTVEDIPGDARSADRDERIIRTCLEYNAILLTADKSMNAFAIGNNVFTIFI